jgi:hypothetical protein
MVYVVEILPYSIRATGISVFWFVTGAAGGFNTYVNPIGFTAFGWKFYFFYVAWIVVEFLVVYWACPETMGTSLEDVALALEGSQAVARKMNPVVEALADEKKAVAETVQHVEKT